MAAIFKMCLAFLACIQTDGKGIPRVKDVGTSTPRNRVERNTLASPIVSGLKIGSYQYAISRKSSCLSETEIFKRILSTYNKHKIPPVLGGGPVIVRMETWIQAISAISDITSDFQTDVYMSERWVDPGLKFQHLIPCQKSLTLTADRMDEIWTPNTCFVNSKTAKIHNSPFRNMWLMLFENGTVWTNYRISLSGPCELNLKPFPMDQLECRLTFESYNYNADEVRMIWSESSGVSLLNVLKQDWLNSTTDENMPELISNLPAVKLADYELIKLISTSTPTEYPAGYWDELSIHFYFRRRAGWYILQAYLPSYLTICISWISFYLGSGLAARTLLGVNSMLALTFQFGNIIQNLPRVSYVKAIDVWMLSCVTFVFCSLLELSFVAYLASREAQQNIRRKQSVRASPNLLVRGGQLQKRTITKTPGQTGPGFSNLRTLSFAKSATDEPKPEPGCVSSSLTLEGVDRISAIVFPVLFVLFNMVYWWYYAFWIHVVVDA